MSVDTGNTLLKIIDLLSDGEIHSGEELGRVLGVSRAAVWKSLSKLADLNVEVISIKGRGYQIVGGLELLSVEKINHFFASKNNKKPTIHVLNTIDSTNAYLLAMQSFHNVLCLAEYQSQGRGRRGRQWISPFAQNIYLSLGWTFHDGLVGLEGLSLAVSVVLLKALKKLNIEGLTLKWPNDILFENKKVAGVLMEMRGDALGDCHIVTGVGINYRMQENDELNKNIAQPWIDLSQIAAYQQQVIWSRNQICAVVGAELIDLMTEFPSKGFMAYRQEWMNLCPHMGKPVEIMTNSGAFQGIMLGLSETGSICIEVNGEEKVFHSGDVSVRTVQ